MIGDSYSPPNDFHLFADCDLFFEVGSLSGFDLDFITQLKRHFAFYNSIFFSLLVYSEEEDTKLEELPRYYKSSRVAKIPLYKIQHIDSAARELILYREVDALVGLADAMWTSRLFDEGKKLSLDRRYNFVNDRSIFRAEKKELLLLLEHFRQQRLPLTLDEIIKYTGRRNPFYI